MTDAIVTAPSSTMRRTRAEAHAVADRGRLGVVIVAALVAVGFAVRLWIMTGRLGTIDSDEAITGLMARHLWDGEFRAFMWRFSYQGTIATYPVALSLKLFGSNQFALELPFLCMSAGAAVVVWRIGTRFLNELQAAIAMAMFWLWPATFVWISVKPLLFYVPTLLLGLAMILCAQRAVETKTRYADWCGAGLLAGLAFWTSPNVSYFIAPLVVWLLVFHWRTLWPRATLTVPFALLGALPWIWNDLHYGFDSFNVNEGIAHGSYLDHLGYFFTHALPVALGLRGAFDGRWIGTSAHNLGMWLYPLVLAALVCAVVLGLRKKSVAALGVVTMPFVFALVPFASTPERDWVGNARYFYWFTPFLALTLAILARRVVATALLGLCVAITTAWGFTRLVHYEKGIGASPSLDRVISILERDDKHTAFASFWISSRMTFESEEHIIAVATDLGPTNQEFEDKVRTSKLPAYVFFAGDKDGLDRLRQEVARMGGHIRETRVNDNFVIAEPDVTVIAPPTFDVSSRP
jgi:4-amino-4-deoxy-L-arabinose transferase-like glycosyltransferase